jgi:uncharacterized membrane protein YccF (DUF307 family)
MRNIGLLSLLAFGVTFASRVQFNETAFEEETVKNVYQVSVWVMKLTGVPATNAYLKPWGVNQKAIVPSNVTGNGPYKLVFEDILSLGIFKSAQEAANLTTLGFSLFSKNVTIASWDLSSEVVSNFPNVTGLDPFKLWPTQTFNASKTSSGVSATFEVAYEGAIDAFGVEVKQPLWKVVVIVISAKIAFSFAVALADFCCQPLYRASSCGKFKILIGNALWLVFGGLETGVLYWLAGVLLMLTIIFLPFGVKLVQFAVFSLFPFGREVKQDVNSEGFCTLAGNIVWLLVIGLPLVLLHFVLGVVLIVLLITIPFGLQHLKLAKIAFMPFGHSVVFSEELHRGDGYERAPPLNQPGPRYV